MKRLMVSVGLLGLALVCRPAAQEPRPDFSGTWVQNAAKSSAPGGPLPVSYVNKIEQDHETLKVVTLIRRTDGESTSERTFTIGKEDTRPGQNGQPSTSIVKWDGRALVFTARTPSAAGSIETRETWTLSPDGRTLTKTRQTSALLGQGPKQTYVLEKQ